MAKFVVEVEGEQSDLEFIKERCVAAVEEVHVEYAANLDGDVFVTSQWED